MMKARRHWGTGKAIALALLVLMQIASALFFALDALSDYDIGITLPDGLPHTRLELLAVVALVLSIVVTAVEMRRVLGRQRVLENQIRAASGAFAEIIEEYFREWALTPSEREVALLAIKGFAIADIARLRETRPGTVKAQLNAVYTKAGVSGRQQLLSLFIEELMGDGLPLQPAA